MMRLSSWCSGEKDPTALTHSLTLWEQPKKNWWHACHGSGCSPGILVFHTHKQVYYPDTILLATFKCSSHSCNLHRVVSSNGSLRATLLQAAHPKFANVARTSSPPSLERDTQEAAAMDGKKPSTFFSPSGLLKRGWNGVASPINAVKDSVIAAATPRSLATPTHRTAQPSPAEYPSLFDVRTPSSARSDGHYSHGTTSLDERGLNAPSSARGAVAHGFSHSSSSRTNSRTSSSSRTGSRTGSRESIPPRMEATAALRDERLDTDEEERAYLEVCHHNLHSVLTNPKATNWSGALLDVFYPLETDIPMLPFPGLDHVHGRDFEPYLKKYGKNAKKYEENHAKPISEQLSSSNVPSVAVADGIVNCHRPAHAAC
ncbi:hypothetical protein FI667_g5425, partial [Globisporangium splendens]